MDTGTHTDDADNIRKWLVENIHTPDFGDEFVVSAATIRRLIGMPADITEWANRCGFTVRRLERGWAFRVKGSEFIASPDGFPPPLPTSPPPPPPTPVWFHAKSGSFRMKDVRACVPRLVVDATNEVIGSPSVYVKGPRWLDLTDEEYAEVLEGLKTGRIGGVGARDVGVGGSGHGH